MVSKEREQIRPAFVMDRGQYDAPGEQVQRGTPEFLPPLTKAGKCRFEIGLGRMVRRPQTPLDRASCREPYLATILRSRPRENLPRTLELKARSPATQSC